MIHPILKYSLIIYPIFSILTSCLTVIFFKDYQPIHIYLSTFFTFLFYIPTFLIITLVFYPVYKFFNKNIFLFLFPPLVISLFFKNPMVTFAGSDGSTFKWLPENLFHWIPLLCTYIWIVTDEIKKKKALK